MAGGGSEIESHNNYVLSGWGESRGDEVTSVEWQVSKFDATEGSIELVTFDAESNKLYLNMDALVKAGIKVVAQCREPNTQYQIMAMGNQAPQEKDEYGQLIRYTGLMRDRDGNIVEFDDNLADN